MLQVRWAGLGILCICDYLLGLECFRAISHFFISSDHIMMRFQPKLHKVTTAATKWSHVRLSPRGRTTYVDHLLLVVLMQN